MKAQGFCVPPLAVGKLLPNDCAAICYGLLVCLRCFAQTATIGNDGTAVVKFTGSDP